jgi:hypothetical protein
MAAADDGMAGAKRSLSPVALRQTYELYLHKEGEPPTFEALTCADEVELLSAMRRRIADLSLQSVEAWRLGEQVMVLAG